jgi:hypothetical protein
VVLVVEILGGASERDSPKAERDVRLIGLKSLPAVHRAIGVRAYERSFVAELSINLFGMCEWLVGPSQLEAVCHESAVARGRAVRGAELGRS